ncbi:hypothetical protein [Streptomyces sp. ME18-1-4]|uniref:hypothetical protein n=1 Tax=Streptomyces sp. ME18-1-4 TaxID=3028685 RepID=UPI0039F69BC9
MIAPVIFCTVVHGIASMGNARAVGLQHAGASKPVVGITLPAGYSFNFDGAASYLTMGSVFLGIDLGARAALRGDLPFTAAPEGDHTPEPQAEPTPDAKPEAVEEADPKAATGADREPVPAAG